MATGIPFIDNIVSGVNNVVSSLGTAVNNVVNYATNTTNVVQSQLGGIISGVVNGISGGAAGVVGNIVQSTPPPIVNYNPNQGGFFNSGNLPPTSIGVAMQPTVTAYQNYNPYQGGFFNSGNLPNTSYTTGVTFDMNQVYNAVLSALGQLPNIIATIQNPYNSPYITQILQLATQLYNSQSQTVSFVNSAIQNLESQIYQSTSNTLRNVGIDVGGFSNILDNTIRDVMVNIGYPATKAAADMMDMINHGLAAQNQAILETGTIVNRVINSITGLADSQAKLADQLLAGNAPKPANEPKDLITQAIDSAGVELQRVLSETVNDALKNPNNFIHQFSDRVNQISSVIDNLKAGRYTSSEQFFDALFGNEPATSLARTLIILASVIPTMISAVQMAGEPALKSFGYLINADNKVEIPDIATLAVSLERGLITPDEYYGYVEKHGFSRKFADLFLDADDKYADVGSMMQAVWRGMITDTRFEFLLSRLDYTPEAINIFKSLLDVIPSPQDLTRIADKRIWGLNLPEKYGQYSELPQQYRDYMAKWGYNEQFTEWIWAAHWMLPSPNQVFEMFQRHVITNEDMQSYLALTDWLPFFRDKLLQISYNPLTRVDIRRMYGLGVLSESDLPARYEAVGFSPQDAQLMTQFTVKYSGEGDESKLDKLRVKIVNQVESLFVRGKISRDEALTRLVTLGEDRQFAELTLNYLVYEQSVDSSKPKLETYKTRAIGVVRTQFTKGFITADQAKADFMAAGLSDFEASEEIKYIDIERQGFITEDLISIYETRYLQFEDSQSEFIANLSRLGLSSLQINQIVTDTEVKAQKKFKLPSEKQMQTWYQNGVVSAEQVSTYLAAIGYPSDYIPIVLKGDYDIG